MNFKLGDIIRHKSYAWDKYGIITDVESNRYDKRRPHMLYRDVSVCPYDRDDQKPYMVYMENATLIADGDLFKTLDEKIEFVKLYSKLKDGSDEKTIYI